VLCCIPLDYRGPKKKAHFSFHHDPILVSEVFKKKLVDFLLHVQFSASDQILAPDSAALLSTGLQGSLTTSLSEVIGTFRLLDNLLDVMSLKM
jgi:hypothetical protein